MLEEREKVHCSFKNKLEHIKTQKRIEGGQSLAESHAELIILQEDTNNSLQWASG